MTIASEYRFDSYGQGSSTLGSALASFAGKPAPMEAYEKVAADRKRLRIRPVPVQFYEK
ncbi:hypothetical protein [Pseudomonas sp. RW3S2]|uniref:hypothetical protein n=1 Tax=Pseudomonas sp. RW3S2 TaxID=485884 RepID=UPI0016454C1F|nr:hypothetical protein [Pseudomonas sp. RW3S2]